MTKTNEEIIKETFNLNEFDLEFRLKKENVKTHRKMLLLMQKARAEGHTEGMKEVINKIDSICDNIREYSCMIAKESPSQAIRASGMQNACASIEAELDKLRKNEVK